MTGSLPTEEVSRRYDAMADHWRLLGIVDAILLINRLRRRHFARVSGEVLDVGCGTGENFPYLTKVASITAIDLSDGMVTEARRRARQMQIDVHLVVGDAGSLPFPDGRFDFVVSALSSCTFTDHAAAFREMSRVTRPGGRILLLEHGRSRVGWLARRQDLHATRVIERTACRNNRNVADELADGGLKPATDRASHFGMLHRITVVR